MKLTLIEGWGRTLWRAWSVRLIALGTVIQTLLVTWGGLALDLWNMMPMEVRAHLPARFVFMIPALCYVAGGLARIIRQEKIHA